MNIPLVLIGAMMSILLGAFFVSLYLMYILNKEVDRLSLKFMKFRSSTYESICILKNRVDKLVDAYREDDKDDRPKNDEPKK